MSKRTRRDFPTSEDMWAVVEEWAVESGFQVVEHQDSRRLYRKGRETFDFPIMVSFQAVGGRAQLEAWVKASTFDRGRALFLIPAEMGLESGGAQMAVARTSGRKLVNTLLNRLGQPPIV